MLVKFYESEKIRNIAVVGHGSCGKTSLVEAMLFASGATKRLGRVEDGTTVTDFTPEEKGRHISISASLAYCDWNGYKFNIIDAPGYDDFIGEVILASQAVDAFLIVVDAASGVQVQTEKVWSIAREKGLPCLLVVNRLDKENTDFNKAVESLQSSFGKRVVPLHLPIGGQANFNGIANVLTSNAYIYVDNKIKEETPPDNINNEMSTYKEQLVEFIAEADDNLLEKYLDGQELTKEELKPGLKKVVCSANLFPIFCTSAINSIGINLLLDAVTEIIPSPKERGFIMAKKPGNGEEIKITSDQSEPFSGLVFKTIADPYVGKLSWVRIFSGSLSADSTELNVNKEKKERLSHLLYLRGKEQIEAEKAVAGDIVAIPKLSQTATFDTLCDPDKPIIFPAVELPEPLVAVAVEAKTKADEEKLSSALSKIAGEDQTVRFYRDSITKQSILSANGELQIDIILEKLRNRYKVEAITSEPKIPYKETIKKSTKVQGKYKKQTGGRGQYGDVWLEIEPLPRGKGFEFVDKIVGGAVPKNYIPAVEKGVRETMEAGILTNFPTVDLKVTLYDGSYHPVDSSEMAFKIAASMALKKGVLEAKPILLEPIYSLEVTVPEAQMGDVMGSLSSKRGKILGTESQNKNQVVKAQAPLAEITHYSTELRSLTGGRGSYTLKFSHYAEVPFDEAEKILKTARKHAESD